VDDREFDRWTRALGGRFSRRGLTGLTAAALGTLGLDGADARKKKKKKPTKKKPTPACQGNLLRCNGVCVDTQTSKAHCGACGNPCGTRSVCFEGSCCTPFCGTGISCGGNDSCGGSCGECRNGYTCTDFQFGGTCVCPPIWIECGERCCLPTESCATDGQQCLPRCDDWRPRCNDACCAEGESCVEGVCTPCEVCSRYEYVASIGMYGSGDGELHYAVGVALDSDGHIFVSENETFENTIHHRIQKFDSDGTFLTKWGTWGVGDGQFKGPYGLDIDGDGNVYAADTYYFSNILVGNHRVQKFDNDGAFVTKWGSLGTSDGQFVDPVDVAVDGDGNIFVLDQSGRVQKFASDGSFLDAWTGPPIDAFGIAVDADGNVYVSDFRHRITKFTGGGELVTSWGSEGNGDGQFSNPRGLAIDPDGNVYVGDLNGHIQKFTSDGDFRGGWKNKVPGDEFASAALDIAVDADGNLYVASLSRVIKYTPVNSAPRQGRRVVAEQAGSKRSQPDRNRDTRRDRRQDRHQTQHNRKR
jgi:DNA-binding beta-propeller fold protein YncE